MTVSPDFAVVVVNYGAHAMIARNLPARGDLDGAAVYVVDNPSTVVERAAVADLCARRGWNLVPSAANEGFGSGVNQGVRAAIADGAEVVVLLNPDAAASGVALSSLARGVRDDPITVASPRVVTSSGHAEFSGAVVSLRTGRIRSAWVPEDDDPEWVNWLTGACMAFDRETFEAVGGFDPGYFMYWEDVDFSRRVVEQGRRLAVREDLEIHHDQGGTHTARGSRAKSPLYYYWNCRNRLVFGRRFARVSWLRWLIATPAESRLIFLRGGRRQLLSDPGTLCAAVRGTAAGVVGLRHASVGGRITAADRPRAGGRR